MATGSLVQLETTIKQLPGVLGCVILGSPDGSAAEIQAFARAGIARDAVEGLIAAEIERAGVGDQMTAIHVFELDAESIFGDRQSLERAAELAEQEARVRGPVATGAQPAEAEEAFQRPTPEGEGVRPMVGRVLLSATSSTSEAEVVLDGPTKVVGKASGGKTLHGLAVVAEATLQACGLLVSDFRVELLGASLITVADHEAVLVLVRVSDGPDLIGSALLRDGPASEATVRATLDAVNRILLNP
jgi:hypothetical protein